MYVSMAVSANVVVLGSLTWLLVILAAASICQFPVPTEVIEAAQQQTSVRASSLRPRNFTVRRSCTDSYVDVNCLCRQDIFMRSE